MKTLRDSAPGLSHKRVDMKVLNNITVSLTKEDADLLSAGLYYLSQHEKDDSRLRRIKQMRDQLKTITKAIKSDDED
tara:strand:+ start:2804 stop:3034 length:231 start_codon:yes stop_codon:yes gene_type:complete